MRAIELREYQTTPGVELTAAELAALRTAVPSIAVTPAVGTAGAWDLRPASEVGSVTAGSLRVLIRPKLEIDSLLFLITYAADPRHWREHLATYGKRDDLLEAVAEAFVRLLHPVLRGGLVQGYVTRDETMYGLVGRARFGDQLRRHGGRRLPMEVRYDDFTADVPENQLLAAAIDRLLRLPLRSSRTRRSLRAVAEAFVGVSRPAWNPSLVPPVRWTPLNRHCRPAVELARRILRRSSFDVAGRGVFAHGLLLDMDKVFEDFVVIALREALALSERSFPQGARRHRLVMDDDARIKLEPDISWWIADRCVFVGDVKYKRDPGLGKHADLYQLLAYVSAAGLAGGLLIYGDVTAEPAAHRVRRGGPLLQIAGLDLELPPEMLLRDVTRLAAGIKRTVAAEVDAEPLGRLGRASA